MELPNLFSGEGPFFFSQPDGQWGTGIRKKYTGSIFFAKASSAGLTNYIIRHNSQKGNLTSLITSLGVWPETHHKPHKLIWSVPIQGLLHNQYDTNDV